MRCRNARKSAGSRYTSAIHCPTSPLPVPFSFGAGTIVLLPAWPCQLNVSFRLHAAQETTVEVVYAGNKLVSLDVEPPARAAAVQWANCVSKADADAARARLLRGVQ